MADEVGSGIHMELVGHTHTPFRRALETRIIVNPGSVGQPKHGRAEACCAICQDGKITLGSAAYDPEQTIEKLRRLSLSAAAFEGLAFVLNGSVPSAPAESSDSYYWPVVTTVFQGMSSGTMHNLIEIIGADASSRPSPIEFEMAYQARIAIDRIKFAIKHTEHFARPSDPLREVGLQLFDALERLEALDRRFQARSRLP